MVDEGRKPAVWLNLKEGEKTVIKFKNLEHRTVSWHFMGKGQKPARCTSTKRPDGKIQMGTCVFCDAKITDGTGQWSTPQHYYNIIENGVEKVLTLRKKSQENLDREIDALRRFAGDTFDVAQLEFLVECPYDSRGWKILSFRVKSKEKPVVENKPFILTDGEKALFNSLGIKEGQTVSKLELFQVLRGQNFEAERAKEITEKIILGGKISFPQ